MELLAQAIDSIFMRVKLNLKNTTFRIEFVPSSLDNRGQAVEIVIGKVRFFPPAISLCKFKKL